VPLPTDFGTTRVYGTYADLDGTAAAGTITFAASDSLRLRSAAAKVAILPIPLQVTLDVNGQFEIQLPATDDPDILPTGWTYTVTERFSGLPEKTYAMSVPLAGGDIDLTNVSPTTPVTPVFTYVKTVNNIAPDSSGNIAAGPVLPSDYYTKVETDAFVARAFVDVKKYGAVGDGVNNDQPAIGSAFNATPTGGVLFIPAGTYLMNTRLIVSKKIRIQGAGKGATTLLIAGAAFQVGASGVEVNDLTILGSAGVQTRLALQSITTGGQWQDWTFRNVKFDGVGLPITRIGSIDSNGATVTTGSDLANNVSVIGCEFTNYKADAVLHINGTHNCLVERCWFYDSGFDINAGDNIKVKSSATGTRIMYNLIERAKRDGIDCYDSKQNTIIGNVIRDAAVHGIEMKFTSTGAVNDRHIIMGNRILNPGTGTAAPGMQLAVDHVTVIGNFVEGGSNYGFRSGPATDLSSRRAKHVLFIGNQAIGNTSHGFLMNGVDDGIVANNVAIGNGGDGFNVLSSANSGIRMSNNVATGNTGTNYNGPSVPATPTSTGSVGEIIYDTSHLYVCVAPNTWRRVALATW
jgi:hypothetical protein